MTFEEDQCKQVIISACAMLPAGSNLAKVLKEAYETTIANSGQKFSGAIGTKFLGSSAALNEKLNHIKWTINLTFAYEKVHGGNLQDVRDALTLLAATY